MKRILFMHQASSIGGGSYCLLNIIRELDRNQLEPIVALQSEGPLAEELRTLGVEVVIFHKISAVPYNRTMWSKDSVVSYIRVRRSKRPFAELLDTIKCDILYLNNMMIYPYLRIAKNKGLKTVVHVREHWPLDQHRLQLSWARKAIYNYADKIIAINHYSASMFPKKEATIVYDWIDMENRYRAMPFNELFGEDMTNKKVLLFTGGFQSIKGADYIVDSFANSVKGDEYRLLILGANSNIKLSGFKHLLKKLLSKFGYYYYQQELLRNVRSDSRIRCVAGVYEIAHIIEQSYCFVSYFRIPHANLALAENIILGNPCIVADNEESREYNNFENYSMLVTPNKPKLFAKQLLSFLNNIEKWQQAANKGKQTVSKLFDKNINKKVLCEVLYSL